VGDFRVIGLIGAGHLISHFLQLTLPPLFPILRTELDVSWAALGLVSSVFYGVSALAQTVAGFVVDRLGARRVLLAGMTLMATAIMLGGMVGSYWMLLVVAALAGLGNSVFHPADYSMLNHAVSARRIARAYSVHQLSGNAGWVLAPIVVGTVTHVAGWRMAAAPPPTTARPSVAADMRILFAVPILMAFGYFALLTASTMGIQTFAVPALGLIYNAPLTLATGALTVYLFGNATGILTGGVLADRATRHDLVAATGVTGAVVLTLVLASGQLPLSAIAVVMAAMGFSMGVTAPSRDMLVRAATPRGASGKVFGFVYSGLDLGSLVAPPIYGWLLDRGRPRVMFGVIAADMLVMILTVIQVRRRVVPLVAPATGG
jgi:FSR family fosmidomycin resistance protein-like MFS transporter